MAAMEGPLSKWTNVMKGWQYRWFVLDPQTGLLSYYTSKEKMMRGSRRGCVRLKGALIGIDDEDDSTFTITCDQKTFHFQDRHYFILSARDAEERTKWVNSLEETILRHSQPRWYDSVPDYTLTLEDFDKKLVEADAYLQILIEQESQLRDKIEKCEDEEQRQKYHKLRTSAADLLESIKQSIVLLQLAKQVVEEFTQDGSPGNAVNPVNGVIQLESYPENNGYGEKGATKSKSSASGSSNSIEEAVECIEDIKIGDGGASTTSVIPDVSVQTPGADAAISPITIQASLQSSPPVSPSRVTHLSAPVPALSYSSSDEEDSFYDADEYLMYEDSNQWDSARDSPIPDIDTKNIEVKSPDPITASQMYEEEEDEEELDCGKHGSIITHLLSQVRIGMDLTKVVLPTFILERRSLLEMFSDFFAHPDLFSNIPDYEDPKDRIVQVTKWFLSAFHAGKKGSVAKKPYNPIIGETFQCLYDFSDETSEGKEQTQEDLVPDGPVPWASKDNVAVLAEQVSHHPPISAFYAENYNKGVSLNAHIWTKSKFLGLSIGVEMIGQGVVSDLKHDEEYMVTFPNGYGRSILTVPWFEMGGKCSISCAKTGFGSTVVFHTKPFYGGSRHRITAEVSHVSDRKPFLTITGEWNGVMTAKWANGQSEVFIDTYTMKTFKKKVRPIDQQGDFESRRLWKDVTYNLKMKNMESATAAKHKLEERQRSERKQRQETGTKWVTKHFYEDGDNYIYRRHLQQRLEEKLEQAQKERQQAQREKEMQLQQQRQAELAEQQRQLRLQQKQLQQQQAQLATQIQHSQPLARVQTAPADVHAQAMQEQPNPPAQNQQQQLPTAAETQQPAAPEQTVSAGALQETGLPTRMSQPQMAQQEIQDLLG